MVVNKVAVSKALEDVAADYPDLDKSKYGYEVVTPDDILRGYMETLVEYIHNLPVVEHLASSTTLLTPEAVWECAVDQDPGVAAEITSLSRELEGPQ